MTNVQNLKFTKTHEWARRDSGNTIVVGISDYAQKEIRDIVYIELPKVGKEFNQSEPVGTIESVKAAFEIYAPIAGKIIEVNQKASQDVTLVHKEPFESGWLYKMEARDTKDLNNLMDYEAYDKMTKEGH